jgi:hypothetical protein
LCWVFGDQAATGRSLHTLDLSKNSLKERGAAVLSGLLGSGALPSLRRLTLGWNGIGDEGLRVLASALAKHKGTQLTQLDLNDNNFARSVLASAPDCLVLMQGFCMRHRVIQWASVAAKYEYFEPSQPPPTAPSDGLGWGCCSAVASARCARPSRTELVARSRGEWPWASPLPCHGGQLDPRSTRSLLAVKVCMTCCYRSRKDHPTSLGADGGGAVLISG